MSYANPYTSTDYEMAWSEGYSHGYYNPSEETPYAPSVYVEYQATVYLEGVVEGQRDGAEAAAAATGDGGYTGDTEYSGVGETPASSEVVTNPEVTVYGDQDRPVDPNSEADAYGDGYTAGYYATGYDDSNYADTVKQRYSDGWSAGAAAKKLEGSDEHHSAGAEFAVESLPHVVGEWIGHLLGVGFGGAALGAILGGPDTQLSEAPVYHALCHRSDHGLSGDSILDAGAWHGTPTYDYNAATIEGQEHANNWDHHNDAVHIWSFKDDTWDMWE